MSGAGKRKVAGKVGEPTLREQRQMLCENLGFTAAEAYKQLRANLMFALPDEKKCRIVGVTSAVRGEGKSTTSINLSYTLAETEKKVLLIDADMRMPSVAKRMAVVSKPGITNVLAGLCAPEDAIQKAPLLENWYILPAGEIPPNPSELLGSEQMQGLLEKLSEKYDFIVVDLPPVNIVSDAMVVAQWISGLLMVVRADATDKRALSECMRNLQVLKAKLLGFVVTDMAELAKRYRYYKGNKYGYKYGHRYGYGYGYGYGSSKARGKAQKTAPDDAGKDGQETPAER